MKRIVILVAAILLVPVNAAFAHAGLVSSNPAANTEVTLMPNEISLTFTEDLMVLGDKSVNSLSLNLMDGAEVTLTDLKVDGAVLSAKVAPAEFDAGTYEIFYTIVSADGHKLSDSYSFSLNAPTPLIAPAPEKDGHGVLPLPIVAAIALVLLLGGFYAFRARNRKR
jgi:methionine-rich copper-binding protein CopC